MDRTEVLQNEGSQLALLATHLPQDVTLPREAVLWTISEAVGRGFPEDLDTWLEVLKGP